MGIQYAHQLKLRLLKREVRYIGNLVNAAEGHPLDAHGAERVEEVVKVPSRHLVQRREVLEVLICEARLLREAVGRKIISIPLPRYRGDGYESLCRQVLEIRVYEPERDAHVAAQFPLRELVVPGNLVQELQRAVVVELFVFIVHN